MIGLQEQWSGGYPADRHWSACSSGACRRPNPKGRGVAAVQDAWRLGQGPKADRIVCLTPQPSETLAPRPRGHALLPGLGEGSSRPARSLVKEPKRVFGNGTLCSPADLAW